jgi:hypothetical protein
MRVGGKSEYVLRIGLPEPARTTEHASDGAAPTTTSGTSFLAQKAAARRSAAVRGARVRAGAEDVFARLSAKAIESNRRPPEASTGLLLDAAFLVGSEHLEAFKRELSTAAESLLRDGCRVSLTGPWPPYSFVDLGETT